MGKANQALTGLAASFAALVMGSLNVWPSYTIQKYTSPNTTVLSSPMSEFQVSLVGSLPSLGAMLGTVASGVIINSFGRKRGAILLVLPYIVHWVIIQFSSSALPIIVARFIGGIPGGAYVVYAPIYISEICEPSIRGALASGTVSLYSLGALVSYLNGWFLSYETIIWVNLLLCVINLILLSVVVESPVFYLKQNKEQAALKALAHYRNGTTTSKSVLEELSEMKELLLPPVELVHIRTDVETKDEEENFKLNDAVIVEQPKMSSWKLLVTTRSSRKAFALVFTVLTLQVFMGAAAIQVYAGELFSKAAPGLSADFCSVLVALMSFAGSALTAGIADKAGRRVLIISSSVLVALCMSSLGLQLQSGAAPAWVAAVIILVFCFVFYYGAGAVPYVLLAEVFSSEGFIIPVQVQSIASMILVEWMWFTNFVLIAVFPFLISQLGIHGSCYVFAGVAITNAIYSHLRVPETKGLSGGEIQAIFSK